MRLVPVLALVAVSACRSFDLPEPPASTSISVEPSAAFAGQTVLLRFSGALPDLDATYVAIGGQIARKSDEGAGWVRVEIPRLEGCARDVPIEIGSAKGVNATLAYLGAGHPGEPRVELVDTRPLSFDPEQMVSSPGGLAMSAFGSLVVTRDETLGYWIPGHGTDYVSALQSFGDCSGVLYVGFHGDIGIVKSTVRDPVGGGEVSAPAPDLEGALPSAVYDRDFTVAAELSGVCPGEARLSGFALDGRQGRAFVLAEDDLGTVQGIEAPPSHALSTFLNGERGLVAPIEGVGRFPGLVAARRSGPPTIGTFGWSGEARVEHELPLLASMSPVAASARSLADGSFLVAVSWRYEGYLEDTGEIEAGSREDAGLSGDPSGKSYEDSPTGPGISLSRLGSSIDGAVPGLWIPTGELLATSLALESDGSSVAIYAVDGEHAALWRFSSSLYGLEDAASTITVLPGSARHVVTTPEGQIAVGDSSGDVYFLGGEPLELQRRLHVSLGTSAIASRTTASCEDAPVLLAASDVSSLVVAPLRSGRALAFEEGSFLAPVAVEALGLQAPEGARTYYVSAGIEGVLVFEPLAQARERGASTTVVALHEDDSRALGVALTTASAATIVSGGDWGLRAFDLGPGMAAVERPGSGQGLCSGTQSLVVLGDQVLALTDVGGQGLCVFDLATGAARDGGRLAEGWQIERMVLADSVYGLAPDAAVEPASFLVGKLGSEYLLAIATIGASGEVELEPLELDAFAELLPNEMEISAAASSPDGRRLLVGLRGDSPGVLVLDPLCLLELKRLAESGEPVAAKHDECQASLTTISLPTAPLGFSLSEDGARAIAALEGDELAILE